MSDYKARIVMGRSGSGKTTYIIDRIKEDLANGCDNILVIAPDQFIFETERKIMKETGKGLFAVRVLSFRRLISLLRDELGTGGWDELDEVGKAMIMCKLLYDYDTNLQVYKGAYHNAAFGVDMAKVITECKQFGISPSELKALDVSGRTGAKLKDIQGIYEQYALLNNRFKDNEDIINGVISRIKNSRMLKGARIYIDHFDVFTFQGYNTIKEMAKVCDCLTVCLCSDGSEKGLFSMTTGTVNTLKDILGKVDVVVTDKYHNKASIGHLERNLFDGKGEVCECNDGSVELYSFANALGEIDHAAAMVLELVKKGYSYSDICVMTGDIEEYGKATQQCFEDCNIPTFIDRKTPLMAGRIARFLVYSLRYCISHEQSDYISLIKQGIGIWNNEDIFTYENYILKYGLKKALAVEQDDKKIAEFVSVLEKTEDNEDRRRLHKLIEAEKEKDDISRIRSGLHSKKLDVLAKNFHIGQEEVVSKYVEVIRNYINGFDIAFEDETEEKAFKRLTQILDRMESIFDGAGDSMSATRFLNILETGMNAVKVGAIPDRKNCVIIGDISRTKIESTKCLLVLGISDGVIPKLTQKTGILSDYDSALIRREKLPTATGERMAKIGRDSADLNNLERLLTYKMFSKPTDYLYLSHSDRGVYGNERTNKILFPRIQKLFTDMNVICDVPYNEGISKRLLNNERLALRKLYGDIVAGSRHYMINGAYDYFLRRGIISENLYKAREYDLTLPENEVEEVYRGMAMSASRIESYFKCAFMHFVKYGLKPKPRELFKINKLDTGSLLHSIVEVFSRDLMNGQTDIKDKLLDDNSGYVEGIVDDYLRANDIDVFSDRIGRVMQSRIVDISKSALLGVLDELERSNYVLTHSEEDLRSLGNYTTAGIEIKGRIDRVDIRENENNNEIRIIDYKTGGADLDYTGIYAGIKLQLIIYMDAVMKYYNKEDREYLPAEIEYLKMNTDYKKALGYDKLMAMAENPVTQKISALKASAPKDKDMVGVDELTYERMEDIISFGIHKIEKGAKEIKQGNISVNPYREKYNKQVNACTYCQYMDICKNSDMSNCRELGKMTLSDLITQDTKGKEE